MLNETIARLDAAATLYDAEGKRKPQNRVLIDLACNLEMFHDAQGNAYALIEAGHREVWPIKSSSFSEYLHRAYYRLTGSGANRNAMSEAVATLSARARFDCCERKVYSRVALDGDSIYIDLADNEWRVVKVTADGWCVLDESPVMFVRGKTAAPLPIPQSGGSIDLLKPFINVADRDWPLVVGWILNAYGPGPFTLLVLIGEQGTAKSTTARIMKSLTDPSTVPLRAPPRDEEQLLIAAQHSWVLALDNLSGLTPQLSDALCRLSTGGGFGRRQLYTDCDEVAIDLQRPCILNGIDDIASRPDLSERSITLQLQPITRRLEERIINADLDEVRPAVMGAICDAISAGVRHRNDVRLDNAPRMADSAAWITACEHAPGMVPGSFMEAFLRNQAESIRVSLETSPVTAALLDMMADRTEWRGTATLLLNTLMPFAEDEIRRSKAWPKSGDWLSRTLMRFGQPLRSIGIDVVLDRSAPSRRIEINRRASSKSSRHSCHGVTVDDAMTPVTPDFGGFIESSIVSGARITPFQPHPTDVCPACAGEGCSWCRRTRLRDSQSDERVVR
jgi:hypothetical protein